MLLAQSLIIFEHILIVELHLLKEEQAKFPHVIGTVTLTAAELLAKDGRTAYEWCGL